MHYPYRCKKCGAINYSEVYGKAPQRCDKCPSSSSTAQFQKLASICLCIPPREGEDPVFETKDFEPLGVVGGATWVFACGRREKPKHFTDNLQACTCKKCREYAEEYLGQFGWSLDSPVAPESVVETTPRPTDAPRNFFPEEDSLPPEGYELDYKYDEIP